MFKYANIDGRECTSWLAEKRVNTTRGSVIRVKQLRPKKYASLHGPEGLCGRVKFYIRVLYGSQVLELARVNFFKWDQRQTRSEWCIDPTAGVYTHMPYVLVSDIKCLVVAPEVPDPQLGEMGKRYFVLHMDQAPLGNVFYTFPTNEPPPRRPRQGRASRADPASA